MLATDIVVPGNRSRRRFVTIRRATASVTNNAVPLHISTGITLTTALALQLSVALPCFLRLFRVFHGSVRA